jgi:hypothetical protein
MNLDKEAIGEFIQLYKQEYSISLTTEEATAYGMRLIKLIQAVYGDNLPKLKDIDTNKKKEDN